MLDMRVDNEKEHIIWNYLIDKRRLCRGGGVIPYLYISRFMTQAPVNNHADYSSCNGEENPTKSHGIQWKFVE